MGMLRCVDSDSRIVLQTETSIGRSVQCAIQISSSFASSIHACIRWTDRGWGVKDLGSTNGTFVNGVRVDLGREKQIQVGDKIWFGSPSSMLEMVDGSAPGLAAVADDGEVITASGEVLTIPPTGDPVASIYRSDADDWRLERPTGAAVLIKSGDRFEACGRSWSLLLPDDVTRTNAAKDGDIRESKLLFCVSADEETVDLSVISRTAPINLGARASNYLLLTLARQRLKDEQGGMDETDSGWMYLDQLARGLRTAPENINVDVFRLRRRLGEFFYNSAQIIERRSGTGQLRLGVRSIEIVNGQ